MMAFQDPEVMAALQDGMCILSVCLYTWVVVVLDFTQIQACLSAFSVNKSLDIMTDGLPDSCFSK
jgi:hypothetical protein